MLDFLISPAYAQSAGGAPGISSELLGLAPIVPIFLIMYFMLIRPQQKKQKDLKAELASLRRGDRVVTGGGIIGVVQKVRDDSPEIEVEIAQNVRVMVLRDTVTTVLSSTSKPANDAGKPR